VFLFRPYHQEKQRLREQLEALPGLSVVEFRDFQEEESLDVEVFVELIC